MTKKGRRFLAINKTELEKLLAIYTSEVEVAAWFDCDRHTISAFIKREYPDLEIPEGYSPFSALREKLFVKTKFAIRRIQIEKALKGCNTMLIWVGKNMLGQSDKTETIGDKTFSLNYDPKALREFLKKNVDK